MNGGVVLLAGAGKTTQYVANALAAELPLTAIVLEQPPSRAKMLRRRLRHLGFAAVFGQLLFLLFQKLFLSRSAAARIAQLEGMHNLRTGLPAGVSVHHQSSVNDEATLHLLLTLKPEVVVVNGTRIISQRILNSVNAPFINTHVGITPHYRGVHGGYWALAEGHEELFGTTVHYVDSGVDTGNAIVQRTTAPDRQDNFASYPTLQYTLVMNDIVDVTKKLLGGVRPEIVPSENLQSRQYFHPTLWYYLWKRITRNVR